MPNSAQQGGASVSARSVTPALDLASLVEMLDQSLCAPAGPEQPPFVCLVGKQVQLHLSGPLRRLIGSEGFQQKFSPGEESGFLRDASPPPKGINARMGGRLLHGTETQTARALEKLRASVETALTSELKGLDWSQLTLPSMDEAMGNWAKTISEAKPTWPETANMVPVAFASNERSAPERAKDIGRVLTAIETVDGKDCLEALLSGIANQMRKDGLDEDVEDTLHTLRERRKRPGSLMQEFVEFLEDEALARVRLQVTMRLMAAVAKQSNSVALQQYVTRVLRCYELFGSASGEPLPLQVASVYGLSNNSDLSEHLQKAMFYNCLAVWPQWSVQLFETRTEPNLGFAAVREVSYRFRVNGINPATGKSAFETRLDQLHERLLKEPSQEQLVRRDVAELVFLYLVLAPQPGSLTNPDILNQANSLAAELEQNPYATLARLHHELMGQTNVCAAVASQLIDVLRNKSRQVITLASAANDTFTVSINRAIVDWEALASMTHNTEVLRQAQRGDNAVEWFKYLSISEQSVVPGTLASYSVKTEIKERSLTLMGGAVDMQFERDLSAPVLAVRMVPYKRSTGVWVPDLPAHELFDLQTGIELRYEMRLFEHKRKNNNNEMQSAATEQYRAASVTAFTLLAYVALWVLQANVRRCVADASLAILRLQHSGRKVDAEDDADDPNTAVYAVSQAIEKALAREGPTKLQGLTTQAADDSDNLRWKRRGALVALASSQKMKFTFEGALERVALVSYVTRPCDQHPDCPDADSYLFLSRTYTAQRTDGEGRLSLLHMRSRLVDSSEDFKNPQPILEEIARLYALGYRHVMLLSHHFGNRHIGRAAERHAPHGSLEFLDAALQKFPNMHLYLLRRDVFPATRLRQREGSESAFEVLHFKDHQELYDSMSELVLRSIVPVYTFATLAVVGNGGQRPQSGFCTYFYDGEQRILNLETRERLRQYIVGIGDSAAEVRRSLISVLRGVHFLECEKAPAKGKPALPVLDPYGWVNPVKRSAAGEIAVVYRRRSGSVLLSLPAVLAQVTPVLHKEAR